MAGLHDLHLGAGRLIPVSCLRVRTSRSGGPGGQNVNKTETKVSLLIDLAAVELSLGEVRTARIRQCLHKRIDGEDRLVITCATHRSQARNLDEALERATALLRGALTVAKPRKRTRPTRGSVERRLTGKRQRSDIKRQRRGLDD